MTTNLKEVAYRHLVEKRKSFHFAELLNPSEIEGGRYDCDHAESWAQWMGNLDARVMLVGKDFGGSRFFRDFRGGCDPESVTNKNLIRLFATMGISIGTLDIPNRTVPVFFTNSIFGIIDSLGKGGNSISERMLKESATEFLEPLIRVVDPGIIIAMGWEAHKGTCLALHLKARKTVQEALDHSPMPTPDGRLIFTVYHYACRPVSRSSVDQEFDWRRIGGHL